MLNFVRIPTEIRVLRSGTSPQTLHLENFSSPRQVDGVINKTRRQFGLWITLTTVERAVAGRALFSTRWSTVTL